MRGTAPNKPFWNHFLDAYELKARVAAGLIIALPVIVAAFYSAPVFSHWSIFATSSLCSLALLYGLGLVVRGRGRAIEQRLWSSWGGPPSTRFLRHSDTAFGSELKTSIAAAVTKHFSLHLLTPKQEASDPKAADKAIEDAFRQVRTYLRRRDPNGLWSKQNIEYGFSRNLLGARWLWAVIRRSDQRKPSECVLRNRSGVVGVRGIRRLVRPISCEGCRRALRRNRMD